jgi:ElaB/YqjD/DUF883 family membrane-anchored ribosome-binding protein
MADENQMDQGAAVPPQAKEKAERGATRAGKAAKDLRSAAGATTDEYLGCTEGVWDDARHHVRNLQDDSKQYVRDNPTKAVFIALCVGFLVGFTLHR